MNRSLRKIHLRLGSQQLNNSFSSKSNGFVAERSKYQTNLSELRKAWQTEFELKAKLEQDRKDAEKRRIVLERAVKLREQRKESKAKQEIIQKRREDAFQRYKENLAATHLLWEAKQRQKKSREQRALDDLKSESDAWITPDNIDNRITDDLFAKESATTGYATKYSNFWKYQVFTPKLERLLSEEFQDKLYSNTALMDRLKTKAQFRIAKRVVVEDFLSQIIGTGEERANFKALVHDVSQTFEKLDGFEGMQELYEEADSSTSSSNHVPN